VLDDSDLVIWQIRRNAYREALASFAEMQAWRVTPWADTPARSFLTVRSASGPTSTRVS
jgi:hypothetical protein